ncbi:MAG: S8 family peptidase [Bacteroidales bacterium]|nr:S8 family peptidase [Bacteroidales bacterium]
MRKLLFGILLTGFAHTVTAQRIADGAYWYFFTNKNNNGYSIEEPEDFLSQRSIDRRAWQSIPVTERDLPVNRDYIDSLLSMGLEVRHVSKWLNGALVITQNLPLTDTLHFISFLDTAMWEPDLNNQYFPVPSSGKRFEDPLFVSPEYQYGYAGDQVRLMNLHHLHNTGYTGKGVVIAVLDAGFINLISLTAFQSVLADNRIVATRNYVKREMDVYGDHPHGTYVTSIIISDWPGVIMGTAPDASLILATSENVSSETRIEEYAWIEAAEWADSLGADIINTSLGYTTFDDSLTNYSYSDMDGQTAHISIANGMTASMGILSVTSAGNAGNEAWHYIGAPADAREILSVGAVNNLREIAGFSSRGPTYDGRIKPELSAMGSGTAFQSSDSTIMLGGGTSFSSPLIVGGAACLWQAYPELSARDLMQWIKESADRYSDPDINYGYGIPSFSKAYHAISSASGNVFPLNATISVYPNPFTSYINIEIPKKCHGIYLLSLYDILGKKIFTTQAGLPGSINMPGYLDKGIYFIEIRNEGYNFRSRIIKN